MKFVYLLHLLSFFVVGYSYLHFSVNRRRNNCHNAINNKKTDPIDSAPSKELKKQFTFTDLMTLIQMGAGAPSLGEYERTDENGKMFFKLEANNAYDEDGNSIQTRAKYFTDGYVDDEIDKPPGFFENLFSGGKKQGEWESRLRQNQTNPPKK